MNAPPSESRLARIPPGALAERLPGLRSRTAGAEEWGDAIFRERTGREVTRWLVGALLALLAVEMAAAASGRSRARRGAGGPPMAGASPGRMQPSTAGGGTRD